MAMTGLSALRSEPGGGSGSARTGYARALTPEQKVELGLAPAAGGVPEDDVVRDLGEAGGMRFRVVSVAPELAQRLLGRLASQRRLRRAKVAKFARAMRVGHWRLSPQGIVIAADGTVIDGMHRLTAVVEAGVAVEMLVVSDADAGLYTVIDADLTPKDTLDILKREGVAHRHALVMTRAIRMLWRAEMGRSPFEGFMPTNQEVVATYHKYPELTEAAQLAYQCRDAVPTPSLLCYYLTVGLRMPSLAAPVREQALKLATGSGLQDGDPILTLREDFKISSLKGIKYHDVTQASMIVHAFNAAMRGKKMLTWRSIDRSRVPPLGG